MRGIILYLLLFSFIANAQNSATTLTAKWINDYDNQFVSVRSCVQDTEGFLWIATEMGLYCYDGNALIKIVSDEFPDIETDRISKLHKNIFTGEILFYTYHAANWYIIKKGIITKFNINDNNEFIINDAAFSWAYLDKSIKRELIKIPVPQYNLSIIKQQSDYLCSQFFIIGKYLYVNNFQSLTIIKLDDYTDNKIITVGEEARLLKIENSIFLLQEGLIYEIQGNIIQKNKPVHIDKLLQSFLKKTENNSLGNNRIISGNDKTYIFFDNNVYLIEYINNSLKTTFIANTGNSDVNSVYYDKNNKIYFITSPTSGILMIKESNFKTLKFKNYNYAVNYSVVKVNNNTIYSTKGWEYNLEKDQLEFVTGSRDCMFILEYKNEFYARGHKVLYNVCSPTDTILGGMIDDFESMQFSSYCWQDNILWISTNNIEKPILYLYNKSLEADTFLAKALQAKKITNLFSWKDKIIIATEQGVYEYKPFSKKINVIQGLENVYARNLVKNDSDSYWVCCYGDGIFLVSRGKVYKVKSNNAAINAAHTIELDKYGTIWISTNQGLLSVDKNQIIQNTLQGKTVELYRYTIQEGLATDEFNGGCTHPAINDGNIIGFSNMRGFLWFDPSKIKKQVFNKNIVIQKVTANGEEIIRNPKGYYIDKDKNIVELSFRYAYYFNRSNLSVEYKFDWNDDWKKITENKINFARNTGGTDKLYIRIKTNGTNQSVVKTFNFIFETRYYETTWFKLIVFVLIGLIIYLSFILGRQISKKREELLKKKITESTIELNNIVNQLKISKEEISKSLQEKEILLKEVHHRVKNNLQLIISLLNIQSRRSNNKTDNALYQYQGRVISMALIHKNLYEYESLENVSLETYLNNLVPSIVDLYNIEDKEINLIIETNKINFDIQMAIPFGLITNEIVNNSCKYAKRDGVILKIGIFITENNDFYRIVLQDNGPGFNLKTTFNDSFGIEMIRLLVKQLDGNITILNNRGTNYIIEIPVRIKN